MLYETWLAVCEENADLLALHDYGQDRKFSFGQLRDAVEAIPKSTARVIYPQGNHYSAILKILCAWRDGSIVCPMEEGEQLPSIPEVPSGCIHVKLTSASSGSPKQVAFTAQQILADCDNIISTMGLRKSWPQVGLISISHSYGFSNLVTPLLLRGIPLILGPSPFPDTLRSILSEYPEVVVPGVPALWKAWSDANVLSDHIRLAISAGSPLSITLETHISETHRLKIHNFYGSSECGGIAYDRTTVPRNDSSNLGERMDNVKVEVGDDRCLQIRSKAVGQGYIGLNSDRLGDGLFWTQDLGEIQDGNILLKGRMADVINIAGRKLSPETVEKAITATGLVINVLVFGVPAKDLERSDEIVALVELRDVKHIDQLKPGLLRLLPAWQVPRVFRHVESLQPNQRGKLSRAEWRKRYLESGI